jgi:hypothetical protein
VSFDLGNKPDSEATLPWLVYLLLHCFVAVIVSALIGFFPEAYFGNLYHNTRIEPFLPVIGITALLLGYFASPRLGSKAAVFTWIFGVAWIIYGFYDMGRYWEASWSTQPTRWSYVIANLFGKGDKCSGSECLGELVFTMPLVTTCTYSLGAALSKLRRRVESKA